MDLLDFVPLGREQTLEYRGMFAVYRQDHGVVFAHGPGDQRAGGDQRLLVREGYHLPGLEGRESRAKAAEPDHGPDDYVDVGAADELAQAVSSGEDLRIRTGEAAAEFAVQFVVTDDDIVHVELPGLALEQVDAFVCADKLDLEKVAVLPDDIKCLGSDRTSRSEDRYSAFAAH